MIRDELRDYAAAMNRGDFFLAHEILEEPWKTPGDPLYKDDGIRGLIFVAAAALHARRGNPKGVRSTAGKALARLVPRAPVVHGVAVERMLPLLASAATEGTLPPFAVELSGEPPASPDLLDAVEGYHWDFEAELRHDDAVIVDRPDLYMRRQPSSPSIYHNKVVRFLAGEADVAARIAEVRDFFGGRPFSWWVGPRSLPQDLASRLAAIGLVVHDRYVGMAMDLWAYAPAPTPDAITVREATDEAMVRSHVAINAEAWGYDPRTIEAEVAARLAYMRLAGRRGGHLVAFIGDVPAGAASYRQSEDGAALYLNGAAVRPAFRRRGVYRALVGVRLAMGLARGCKVAGIQAREGTAEPLMRRFGFREVGRYVVLTPP